MEENAASNRPQRRSYVQRNRKLQAIYLAWGLLSVIFLFIILGVFIKDRSFSESENRSLTQATELTADSLKDGSFFSVLSSYTADQFPGRDMWMGLNFKFNRLLGQKEFSGVYLGADDYLMQIPGAPNEEQLQRNLDAINAFGQSHPSLNTVVSIVPNAVTVLNELLPKNAPVRDQKADLAAINTAITAADFVDVTDTLCQHTDEQLFYRTDHHWTTPAACYAFGQIAPSLGIQPPSPDSYTRYTVSDSFEGTLSSKSGSHAARDRVEIFVPATEIEYYVTYDGNPKDICSFYNLDALKSKDHYTVFFGGNHPRVDITTTADTGRCLLLLKDSYANCFVPFLYPYFDHITMVDPRYYYDNLENIISSEAVTDVLFLYNLDTFLSDTSLADVLNTDA